MKKVFTIAFALLSLWLFASKTYAQTPYLETFESFPMGATSFTSNGQLFNIVSNNSATAGNNPVVSSQFPFAIDNFPGNGFNGDTQQPDDQFIDEGGGNFNNVGPPFSFQIKSATSFKVNSFYAYLSDNYGVAQPTGSVTVTGTLNGVQQFSVTKTSGFNITGYQYTLFDMSTLGGADNSTKSIDALTITINNTFYFIGFDSFKWTKPSTAAVAPTVTTTAPSSINSGGATLAGNVTASGGASITARGIVYSSTNTSPTVGGSGVTAIPDASNTTGTFSELASGLSGNTHYYVNAYASNSAGTGYGTVTSFNTAPTVTTTGGNDNYTVNGSAVTVDAGITDNGTANLTGATITIGSFSSGDILNFMAQNGISAAYSGGILNLYGSATPANYQAALRSITFSSTSSSTATRTISFTINNGTASNTATKNITVAAADIAPVVTTTSGSAAFTAGDNIASTPVVVDAGITVTDADNTTLSSAKVQITSNYDINDQLAFNTGGNIGNIAGSYSNGILTLTSNLSTATVSQWQNALRSVTYTNNAVIPNNATRTISFTANDGTLNSIAATKNVTVTDVDQSPIVTASSGSNTYTSPTPVTVDGGVSVSDLDNTMLATAYVQITGNYQSTDVLSVSLNPATTGSITGTYTNGLLTLNTSAGGASIAQWQTALRAVKFSTTSSSNLNRTISFSISDGTKTSAQATKTITVQTPPTVTAGNITISGATGTGGAYKIGDTMTATWNNSTSGDNNSTTVTGVTFDFSQFGDGSAVVASNTANIWTANYTITAGSIDATNRNVSVTATNSTGPTTTAGTNNATIDNKQPVVTTAHITVSGGSGPSGAFKLAMW